MLFSIGDQSFRATRSTQNRRQPSGKYACTAGNGLTHFSWHRTLLKNSVYTVWNITLFHGGVKLNYYPWMIKLLAFLKNKFIKILKYIKVLNNLLTLGQLKFCFTFFYTFLFLFFWSFVYLLIIKLYRWNCNYDFNLRFRPTMVTEITNDSSELTNLV